MAAVSLNFSLELAGSSRGTGPAGARQSLLAF
jgi:hypothetical protein